MEENLIPYKRISFKVTPKKKSPLDSIYTLSVNRFVFNPDTRPYIQLARESENENVWRLLDVEDVVINEVPSANLGTFIDFFNYSSISHIVLNKFNGEITIVFLIPNKKG